MTGPPATFTVHTRRGYWLMRGLGAAVLAVACALAVPASHGLAVGVGLLGAAMFGFFTLYALRQGLRTGPRLTLSEAGVDATDLGLGVIPWAHIDGVQAFGSAQAPFVAFHVADAAPWLARMSPWPRWIARWHVASGLPLFSVNLIGVDRDAGEVVRQAHRLKGRAR
jgi:hypothetical protein